MKQKALWKEDKKAASSHAYVKYATDDEAEYLTRRRRRRRRRSKSLVYPPVPLRGERVVQLFATDKISSDYLSYIQAETPVFDERPSWSLLACCRGRRLHNDGERGHPPKPPVAFVPAYPLVIETLFLSLNRMS